MHHLELLACGTGLDELIQSLVLGDFKVILLGNRGGNESAAR